MYISHVYSILSSAATPCLLLLACILCEQILLMDLYCMKIYQYVRSFVRIELILKDQHAECRGEQYMYTGVHTALIARTKLLKHINVYNEC